MWAKLLNLHEPLFPKMYKMETVLSICKVIFTKHLHVLGGMCMQGLKQLLEVEV